MLKSIWMAKSLNSLWLEMKCFRFCLSKDIDLPYSCQSGVCTACQGKLVSGKS